MTGPAEQGQKFTVDFTIEVKVKNKTGVVTEVFEHVGQMLETPNGGLLLLNIDAFPKIMYCAGEWVSAEVTVITALEVVVDEDPVVGAHQWRPGTGIQPPPTTTVSVFEVG